MFFILNQHFITDTIFVFNEENYYFCEDFSENLKIGDLRFPILLKVNGG